MTQKIQLKKLDIQDYYTSGPGSLNTEILQSITVDPKLEIIFKRAERLRMAFLLLYSKLENKNDKLLEFANKLIFLVLDLIAGSGNYAEIKKDIKITLLQLSELLDFFYLERQLSLSNLQILKDAIITFANLLEDFEDAFSEQDLHFSGNDFFAVNSFSTTAYKGHIKDKEIIKDKEFSSYKGHIKDTQKEHEIKADHKGHDIDFDGDTVKKDAAPKSSASNNKSKLRRKQSLEMVAELQSRRLKIIELLKSEPGLTASQIREKLGDTWSQKTIQRELLSMLKEEILKKEGEKRWTKYSLKF